MKHYADIWLDTDELRWNLTVEYSLTVGYQHHAFGTRPYATVENVRLHSIESLELIWRGKSVEGVNFDLRVDPADRRSELDFCRHANEILSARSDEVLAQINEQRTDCFVPVLL